MSLFELVILVTSFVLEVEVQKVCHTVDQESCTMQSALSVDKNAKFHSNPTELDQFTAVNVFQKEDRPNDIRIGLSVITRLGLEIIDYLLFKKANKTKITLPYSF